MNRILLFYLLLLIGCSGSPENGDIYLTVTEDNIHRNISLSKYVKECSFIKLEDHPNALMGDLDAIRLYDDKFYLLERFANPNISVFSSSGTFLYHLSSHGEGPQEFSYPYDLMFDQKKEEVLVLTIGKLLYFNSKDGSFKKSVKISFPAIRISKIADGYVFVAGGDYEELIITDDKFEIKSKHFKKSVRNDIQPQESFHNVNNNMLFHMTLNDTIYKIDNNNVVPFKIIDFGKFRFSEGELLKFPEEVQHNSSLLKKQLTDYMAYIKMYDETDDAVCFTFNFNNKPHMVLSSKKSNNTIIWEALKVDNDVTFEDASFYIYSALNEEYFVGIIQDPAALKDKIALMEANNVFKANQYFEKLKEAVQKTDFSIGNPILFKIKFNNEF